jgi:hypothetical protein
VERVARSPHREVHALAGEWYSWFAALHEAEPGTAQKWTDFALQALRSRVGVVSPSGRFAGSVEELRAFVADLTMRVAGYSCALAIVLCADDVVVGR